jgi:putative membrane protein
MNRRLLILSAALLAPALPALAQGQRPTAPYFTSGITPSPEAFVIAATHADNFATASGQILLQGSTHPQIRDYATRMIAAHGAMMAERLALPDVMVTMAGGIDEAAQRQLAQLREKQGDDLHRYYVQMQVDAHRQSAEIYERYATDGAVASLRDYATRDLPLIRSYLQQAQALQLPQPQ